MRLERFTVYEDAVIGPLLEPDEDAVCRASDVAALEARIAQLEAALLVAIEDYEVHNGRPKVPHWAATSRLLLTAAETSEAMRARIVTETADAITKERGLTSETETEPFDHPYVRGCPCATCAKARESTPKTKGDDHE